LSGPSRNWIKTKCPIGSASTWSVTSCSTDRVSPKLTEAQKTLARKRVIERLRSPLATALRELRKHVAILEWEIVELEQA
jgi:hypothetical protein